MRFVYIDETGTSKRQPYLYVVAAMVDEDIVQTLGKELRSIAQRHLGFFIPDDFEFHGSQLWGGSKHWANKTPAELIEIFEEVVNLLNTCDIDIAHASIDKTALHDRHGGSADANAYVLAMQFLLEKVDAYMPSTRKVLVADEAKEQEARAVEMVAGMQHWGGGAVPGKQVQSIIDTLHFVRSHDSPGVQMADLVAFVIQRKRLSREAHPDAQAAIDRMRDVIWNHTPTWRETWP